MPGGNGRDSGIAGWENMGMAFKFHMGMGMKSLKWEGIGTKNLFPHTSRCESAGKLLPSTSTIAKYKIIDATTQDEQSPEFRLELKKLANRK